MTLTKAERKRRIFLITKTLLSEGKGFGKDRSGISKFVSSYTSRFAEIKQDCKESSIIDTILNLSNERVFESEPKAKIIFPELFQPSPQRSLQHEISERDAARSEADALRQITNENTIQEPNVETKIDPTAVSGTLEDGKVNLFPSYLTQECQHVLMNFVQAQLEECCYNFAKRWVPNELAQRRWRCPEAVELNRWAQVLVPHFANFPKDATDVETVTSFRQALEKVATIRHTAVHRLPTNAREIVRMLEIGHHLARVLKDQACSLRLEILVQHMSTTSKNIELHKNSIEAELDSMMEIINEQRQSLDQQEKEAISNALRQDEEDTRRICDTFSSSILTLKSYGVEWNPDEREELEIIEPGGSLH